jgi:Ring finger domain
MLMGVMSALLPTVNLAQFLVFAEPPFTTTTFQQEGSTVEIHSMNNETFSCTIESTTATVLDCLFVGHCSSWSLFLVFLYSSVAYSVITRLLFWYNFVTVWNLIAAERRVDSGNFYKHRTRRRLSIKEALKYLVTPEGMAPSCASCCICLCDFYENELVTPCESCGKWYHKECLFEWLQRSDSCPCCRNNMMVANNKSNGFFTDLSRCLGFDPHRRRPTS